MNISQSTNGKGINDHVNILSITNVSKVSHSVLDDSNQFASVHIKSQSIILTQPASSLEPEVFDGNTTNYCSFLLTHLKL